MSYLSVFVSIKIHISCVVINCINSGNKNFDLIPQTFYFWKIKFLFFRPWGIFISRFSCVPVLLIVVVRVSRRGKAHMRFSVSRLKKAHLYKFICEYWHVFFINLAVNVKKLWKIRDLSLEYISKSSLFFTINQEMFFPL